MINENRNSVNPYSDQELIKNWPGFENKYESVNGIELHYVRGGKGTPLILLPGLAPNLVFLSYYRT